MCQYFSDLVHWACQPIIKCVMELHRKVLASCKGVNSIVIISLGISMILNIFSTAVDTCRTGLATATYGLLSSYLELGTEFKHAGVPDGGAPEARPQPPGRADGRKSARRADGRK
jgi:hypothetical protein